MFCKTVDFALHRRYMTADKQVADNHIAIGMKINVGFILYSALFTLFLQMKTGLCLFKTY